MVLATAGISSPSMFVVTYGDSEQSVKAVERLRQAFPEVPILARFDFPSSLVTRSMGIMIARIYNYSEQKSLTTLIIFTCLQTISEPRIRRSTSI